MNSPVWTEADTARAEEFGRTIRSSTMFPIASARLLELILPQAESGSENRRRTW
jgi:hypothetical protein